MYTYIIIGCVCLIGIYFSSKARRDRLRSKLKMVTMMWHLFHGMTPPASEAPEVSFTIGDTNRVAFIEYVRYGAKYVYYAPFRRDYVVKMLDFKAELIREGKENLEITLQPGLAYEISAEELGGSAIIITNGGTGETKTWRGTHRPGYAECLME